MTRMTSTILAFSGVLTLPLWDSATNGKLVLLMERFDSSLLTMPSRQTRRAVGPGG